VFNRSNNPYEFKYLLTGISGEGVKQVFLPDKPPDEDILFKKEQKWTRPELSRHLKKAMKVMYDRYNPDSDNYDPTYISPYSYEIKMWEDQQWERSENGVWFWNNGVATYITGFYYWYLTEWQTYFGYPTYRETDKEITYFIQFCEEDPNCYGILLNTIRRYGKSALMGAWLIYRTGRNYEYFAGAQGESDKKIKKFWDLHIIRPFRKLLPNVQPKFDISSKLTEDIKFQREVSKGKTGAKINIEETDIDDQSIDDATALGLESYMDYRASGEGEYDQAILHSYVMEEPGKTLVANVAQRWDTVKPCLKRGIFIRGKAFFGTTVEYMDVMDKGGRAYQKLFYESDYDKRDELNQTVSGLYAAFLPGDCALEGYFDDYGHPLRDRAKIHIILERKSKRNNPKDYSNLIRKYPLSIAEIFWVNSERCVFNSTILQDRKLVLDSSVIPPYSRYNLKWKNNKRFTEIEFSHDPDNGWYKSAWMFPGDAYQTMANKVQKNSNGTFSPLNEGVFTSGCDPVDHRVQIQQRMGFGEDEFISTRRSKPVMIVKRRYDSSIDGEWNQEILEQRRDEKYPYKTGVYIGYMDTRPNDPNVYYERALMICWLHGMSMSVESAKPGVINYFILNGCQDFIKQKYVPEASNKEGYQGEGTPANPQTINEYTECLMADIEYFGHTDPFVDFINDELLFDPANTKIHDYTVAKGYCCLGEKIRPKHVPLPPLDITKIMGVFRNGEHIYPN
jgi:hypothetical protein